jgi:prepilin-type N-terminal cleavage/methylation domain-containing protein
MRSLLIYGTFRTTAGHSRSRAGFSLVELLVAISIITTLAIVAYVSVGNIQKNQLNARRTADISALSNAVETMVLEAKSLPSPTANRSYFGPNGAYTHSASGAFGITSSLSEDILGKYALSEHPRDPETGVYYRYGLTLAQSGSTLQPSYQIAWVLRDGASATALVRGNYVPTVTIPSLIKGYNSTNFVVDGGTDVLPYNPRERSITASIVSSSGSVTINPVKSLWDLLVLGDEVVVGTGGLASIKVSDGTELSLGSNTNASVLKMSELQIKDDRWLFTRVRLLLSSGEVVARVPELRVRDGNRSDLEIETGGAVAAVRGTIFGVNAAASTPKYITLIAGSLEMSRTGGAPLVIEGTPATGGTLTSNTMTVTEWSTPLSVTIGGATDAPTLTPASPSIGILQVNSILSQIAYTDGLKAPFDLEIIGIAFTGSTTPAGGVMPYPGVITANTTSFPVSEVNLIGTIRFKAPHTGRIVRIEEAVNIITESAIYPVYQKDGKTPDILEESGPGTGSPVAWQATFGVDRTRISPIKISICGRQSDPSTCSKPQEFNLARIPGSRLILGGNTSVLTRVATGTGELQPVTPSCTLNQKFCEDENLMAYADMSARGDLVTRAPGGWVNNLFANVTIGVCWWGHIETNGAWYGCISYTGTSYENLLAASKKIEIIYDGVPSSTIYGSLFQMIGDDTLFSGESSLNTNLKITSNIIKNTWGDNQHSYQADSNNMTHNLNPYQWTSAHTNKYNTSAIYAFTPDTLNITIEGRWGTNLSYLGDKINIAVKESYGTVRGLQKPIKAIYFYK